MNTSHAEQDRVTDIFYNHRRATMRRKSLKYRVLMRVSNALGFVSNFLYFLAQGHSLPSCWRMSGNTI